MWARNKNTKYNNVPRTYKGELYASIKEAAYARDLDLLVKAHDISGWTRQVRIPLTVRGILICNYVIDFVITHNDSSTEYVEIKGFQTRVWRLKWKLFTALYGKKENVKMTVVF